MAAAAFKTQPLSEVGGIPADYPSQIGRGEAQVFGPNDLTRIIQGNQARRAAEERAKAKKAESLEKELEIAKPNILPRDEKRFEQMRADYRQDKLENVNNLNDAEVKARLKQKKQQLWDFGIKSADLHKEVIRRSAKTSEGDWENLENFEQLMDPTYVGSEEGYLGQYVSGQKLLGDIKEKPEPFDLDRDFRLNVLRPLNAAKDKGQTSMTLDDGTVITTKWEELTKEEARSIAGMRLEHPPVAKEAQARFDALPPETQAEFEDYKDYYITQRTTPFIQKDVFQKRTKADQDRGYVWGSGRASGKKWNFVDTVQTTKDFDWAAEGPFLPKEVVGALQKRQKDRKEKFGDRQIHTVRIQNIGTEAENKPISITVDEEGSRVYAFPIAWRYEEGKEDEAKLIIGQKVGTGEDARWLIDEVPANYSSGDIEASTAPPGGQGMTLDRFRAEAGGKKGGTPSKSKTYLFGGKEYSYDTLVQKYGKAKADEHIRVGTFKAK